ncbi:nicotianamine aminotransferase 1-like [Mangifera indica]|uniref:nicotianamine aminotransferase 1-like n=1 Tax=Mangifera indica TaxID=29780 RepID=UPI001CFB89F6|nr:nicotianamine aminotransferase 1-like [Mangifera indica]
MEAEFVACSAAVIEFVEFQIGETAIELGLLVVADEVYGHLAFGSTPFVPMAVFGSSIPIITLGSISKRWSVTGWRLAWLATSDPSSTLQKSRILECIKSSLKIISNPVTFIQGALSQILDPEKTNRDYFSESTDLLREAVEIPCDKIKEIPGITCPTKPKGSLFATVKLDFSMLEYIDDDMDFCVKLAKEKSVVVLQGVIVGLKNWLRISFATDPKYLVDGLERLKSFCQKHSKHKY